MTGERRAVVLRRPQCDSSMEIERLVQVHGLRVVYTVYTDTGPELAARIAIQNAVDHAAEAVVIPYLSDQEARETQAWWVITVFADLVTATGVLAWGS